MKWYFCWCQETEFRKDHNWEELIKISVESALSNTDLEPNFIYDGNPSALTEFLEKRGVKIHYHRLSFEEKINQYNQNPQYRSVARGAFLRFDIPLLEKDDKYVLYTDADVIFSPGKEIFKGYDPEYLAAAPQFDRGSLSDMNSGVMIMNLDSWREKRDDLLKFTFSNLNLGLDQEILRVFLDRKYLLLPDRFNWKPYWGINPDAAILHWHGPKPETVKNWLLDKNINIPGSWRPLLEIGEESYKHYIKTHDFFLNLIKEKESIENHTSNINEIKNISPVRIDIKKIDNGVVYGEIYSSEHPESPISMNIIPNVGNVVNVECKEVINDCGSKDRFYFELKLDMDRIKYIYAKDLALRDIIFSISGAGETKVINI